MQGYSKLLRFAAFGLTIISLASIGSAQTVSTTPGFLNAGELERGTEAEMTFFVSAVAEQNITLDVQIEEPISSRLWGDDIPVENQEYSQQDIRDWIDVPDQITVDPSNTVRNDVASGNERLVVEMEVPEDAEPGFHAARIELEVTSTNNQQGFGTQIYPTSVPEFMFRVPGEATREIELSDLEAVRTGEDKVQLLATFQNTGTVTVESRGGTAEVVNSNGRSEGTITVPNFEVAPGESVEVDTTWSGSEGGQYSLQGTANYITGEAYVGPPTAQFAITGAIEEAVDVQDGSRQSEQVQNSTPLWIVIMVLVVLGAVMYSMDVDPFWIVVLLGLLAVGAAVVFTGLPNWLLVLLVLGGVAVAYI